jgi:putative FmdB family regulatory protein
MATYAYRCARCGPFDLRLPIGTAPGRAACPACGGASRRVFTAPALASTPREVAALRDREEASGTEPEVVTSPLPGRPMPPRGRPSRS